MQPLWLGLVCALLALMLILIFVLCLARYLALLPWPCPLLLHGLLGAAFVLFIVSDDSQHLLRPSSS